METHSYTSFQCFFLNTKTLRIWYEIRNTKFLEYRIPCFVLVVRIGILISYCVFYTPYPGYEGYKLDSRHTIIEKTLLNAFQPSPAEKSHILLIQFVISNLDANFSDDAVCQCVAVDSDFFPSP